MSSKNLNREDYVNVSQLKGMSDRNSIIYLLGSSMEGEELDRLSKEEDLDFRSIMIKKQIMLGNFSFIGEHNGELFKIRRQKVCVMYDCVESLLKLSQKKNGEKKLTGNIINFDDVDEEDQKAIQKSLTTIRNTIDQGQYWEIHEINDFSIDIYLNSSIDLRLNGWVARMEEKTAKSLDHIKRPGGLRPGGASPLQSSSVQQQTKSNTRKVFAKEELLKFRDLEICLCRPDNLQDMTVRGRESLPFSKPHHYQQRRQSQSIGGRGGGGGDQRARGREAPKGEKGGRGGRGERGGHGGRGQKSGGYSEDLLDGPAPILNKSDNPAYVPSVGRCIAPGARKGRMSLAERMREERERVSTGATKVIPKGIAGAFAGKKLPGRTAPDGQGKSKNALPKERHSTLSLGHVPAPAPIVVEAPTPAPIVVKTLAPVSIVVETPAPVLALRPGGGLRPSGTLRPGGLRPGGASPMQSSSVQQQTKGTTRKIFAKEKLLKFRDLEICRCRPHDLQDMTVSAQTNSLMVGGRESRGGRRGGNGGGRGGQLGRKKLSNQKRRQHKKLNNILRQILELKKKDPACVNEAQMKKVAREVEVLQQLAILNSNL